MVIINQGKNSLDSQGNADGSIEEEVSNKLNRTQSVKILKSEDDNEVELQLQNKLNEDSEKDLKQMDSSNRSQSIGNKDGGINEIVD